MMKETGKSRAFIYAILIHLVFFSMLVVSFEWTPRPQLAGPQGNVVKAVVVNETKVQQEMKKLKQADRRKQAQKEADLKKLNERVAREQQRLDDLQKKRQQQEAQRQEAERRRAEAQAKQKQRERQEAQRLQKIKEQQEAAEKKRKEEEKRLAELKAKEAEQERRRKEAEQALQAQLAQEQARRDQSTVEQYMGLIKQKVERNWVRPAGWPPGQTCKVDIHLIPDGEVADVRIVKSCGTPLFDQSVESAVSRASPLPLPPDTALFDRFREITFNFNPKEQ